MDVLTNSMSASQEHDIETFIRVQERLNALDKTMRIKWEGPLVDALDKISCFPFVSYTIDCPTFKMKIAGVEAGDCKNPNVDVILEKSIVSSFGKGERTVTDLEYRNGREIPGADIEMGRSHDSFIRGLEKFISTTMFVGRNVQIKLHKLAIYEPGGHFDWHMDSTHSDQHHATVLIALNTVWKGGDLVVKRNDIETRASMQPRIEEEWVDLQLVGFYTDTEHKVEPVSEGVRIVLQYDVEVTGWVSEEKDDNEKIEQAVETSKERQEGEIVSTILADEARVGEVVKIIESDLKSKEEVGLAMQHLYRKRSILPEFLKGADSQLYNALANRFDVALSAVVLHGETDYEGAYGKFSVEAYDYHPASDAFYVPRASAIELISRKDYIEHTGNEWQAGQDKYFGSGMFVSRRKSA